MRQLPPGRSGGCCRTCPLRQGWSLVAWVCLWWCHSGWFLLFCGLATWLEASQIVRLLKKKSRQILVKRPQYWFVCKRKCRLRRSLQVISSQPSLSQTSSMFQSAGCSYLETYLVLSARGSWHLSPCLFQEYSKKRSFMWKMRAASWAPSDCRTTTFVCWSQNLATRAVLGLNVCHS